MRTKLLMQSLLEQGGWLLSLSFDKDKAGKEIGMLYSG